ncbi:MAG TPA: DUF1428 family protein [Ramlibacter sp.]|uniref:DUF1428 domain-containing protein n=1 Tax=Ramlibacter sp. TaxID=1917967 RepID=UPI002D7F931C|nr:DUF1428 family protein [Ramlibacter sp.]HET8747155.1 DUF1428 family protein [Ramlibacter sp.]
MPYVDGFVLAVPNANKEAYRASAAKAWVVFKEFGATRHVECWADDVPDGQLTDFKRAVQARGDESVVFSWIEYPSKEVRDDVYRRMKDDPRMKDMDMPFDGKRMIYGGFAPIFDERA